MVAGHLQEKNGIYYVVLTYKTYDGKRKTKWQSTGLPIKGNKRRAEAARCWRQGLSSAWCRW